MYVFKLIVLLPLGQIAIQTGSQVSHLVKYR